MQIERKQNQNRSKYLVWNETKTQIIASATLKDSAKPVTLKRIDVTRNRRSDGIGTELLKRILSDFENSKIVADVFSSRVDWYERHGFEAEKEMDQLVKVKREPQ